MIDGIEEYYQAIADSVLGSLRHDWTTAKLEVVFYPDGSQVTGEYARKSDGKTRDLGASIASLRAFSDLRNQFKKEQRPLWGRATFEMSADGKFNLKWGYDDCDENGFAIFDDEAAQRKFEERFKRLTS